MENIQVSIPQREVLTISERVTGDRQVHRGPALIYSVVIASDGNGEADAVVYDGSSADDKRLFDLYCVDESMAQLEFRMPVVCSRGIYVDIGTNCQSVVINYLPIQP